MVTTPHNTPAIFSPCRTWRYTLRRFWGGGNGNFVAFICLNPSTADETLDDPTVRRCINFAKAWGFSGMFMLNIFAYRSTDPKALYHVLDPIGPLNDRYIKEVLQLPDVTRAIAAWGNHGAHLMRGWSVFDLAYTTCGGLYRLGTLTKAGQPRHPLYLKGDLQPTAL